MRKTHLNEFGQVVGEEVDFTPPELPELKLLAGQHCRLEPLDLNHEPELFRELQRLPDGSQWTYLPYGPFTEAGFHEWMLKFANSADTSLFAIIDPLSNQPLGVIGFLNPAPTRGSIEIGHVHFGPRLKHTAAATESVYLLLELAFDLGMRRVEWKCHSENTASARAAERLGFTFEGVFRQDRVVKGRSRDTAWFSMLDKEWFELKSGFKAWLDPSNFDDQGAQLSRLSTHLAD